MIDGEDDAHRPLPVVLRPVEDELLSSWLARHAAYYGVTGPFFAKWLMLGTSKLSVLDHRLGLAQVARLSEKLRRDPIALIAMTFIDAPAGSAELISRNRAPQICRPCADRHAREGASGAVPKHWRKAWRAACGSQVAGPPPAIGRRPARWRRRKDRTCRAARKPLAPPAAASPARRAWRRRRSRRSVVLLGVAGGRDLVDIGTERLLVPRLPGAQHVEADSGDDGGEPGREIFDAGALGTHEAEPGFLNRVLRLARRTQHAIGDGT